MKPDSVTAAHTGSEMIFRGPGRGDLSGSVEIPFPTQELTLTTAVIEAKLSYSHGEQPVIIHKDLAWSHPQADAKHILSRWIA
jgi:hypothetical protein